MIGGEISPTCQDGIREACATLKNACEPHVLEESIRIKEYESEFGRMLYTISILIMFSFVIILLMVRSIKRTHSTVEMDALLDAMRFREELDIRDRQRRRLMKAKTKVSAWLNRAQNGNGGANGEPKRRDSEWKPPPNGTGTRPRGHYSISTVTSDIPEIVVSADDCINTGHMMRPHTPAISLIYDFGTTSPDLDEQERRKTSVASTGIPMSSSSSSSLSSSCDQKMSSMKTNPRTFSLDTNASTTSRNHRVEIDDKSFSLDA